jgi:hypothetical protein
VQWKRLLIPVAAADVASGVNPQACVGTQMLKIFMMDHFTNKVTPTISSLNTGHPLVSCNYAPTQIFLSNYPDVIIFDPADITSVKES